MDPSTQIQSHSPATPAPAPDTSFREGPAPETPDTPSIALELRPTPTPILRTKNPLVRLLVPFASLRITVVLFVLSLLLVYYGTLAQVDNGIWTIVNKYFRSGVVFIPTQIFLSNANYANKLWDLEAEEPLFELTGTVPFPGGWMLGTLLLINLLAANVIQFIESYERYNPRRPQNQVLTYLARRGGILLIHTGMVVMMLGELITGLYAVEGLMTIEEGQSVNYVVHAGTTELAVTHHVDAKTDSVVAVPASLLRQAHDNKQVLDDPRLPFTAEVVAYMVNSELKDKDEAAYKDVKNPATAGVGLYLAAIEEEEVSGVSTEQKHDAPSAYITLKDRLSGKAETYLFSAHLAGADWIKFGDKEYQVELRFKRSYRDYTFTLEKFQYKKFQGDEKARDFRSFIHMTDPSRSEDRKIEIFMNNPFRYHGETFYQSSFLKNNRNQANGTVLQVVRNPGAWLPYISCLMVGLGLTTYFSISLVHFIERRKLP